MSLFSNIFSSDPVKSSWESYISNNSELRSLVSVINSFFIPDKIKPANFITNFKIIELLTNGHSKYEIEIDEKLLGTKTFEEHFHTDLWMLKKGMSIDNWFISAYPDAYMWYQENHAQFEDEANKIYEANKIDDNIVPHAFYRFVVDKYVSNGLKLECSI